MEYHLLIDKVSMLCTQINYEIILKDLEFLSLNDLLGVINFLSRMDENYGA